MPLVLTRALLYRMPSPWGWRCKSDKCIKRENQGVVSLMTLNECKLTCGAFGSLWPQPRTATIGKKVVEFLPSNVLLKTSCSEEVCQLVEEAFSIFKENLEMYHPDYSGGPAPWADPWDPSSATHTLTVLVRVVRPDTYLTLDMDESYELSVTTREGATIAIIMANTFFGARHALETLSQLVAYHENSNTLMIVGNASIYDQPAFKYRGLLLDTSRNFFSVAAIKRTLDAMAANKLNTFHWHITDSHSFPLYLESLPNMAFYGAYTSRQVYHAADVRHLVQYGRVRGIRVLPEFDAPAHVGNGWQWAERQGLGRLAVCINRVSLTLSFVPNIPNIFHLPSSER